MSRTNDSTMVDDSELDALLRRFPLKAASYSQPFLELVGGAAKTNGFTSGDPSLLRETVSGMRGLKDRAMTAATALSMDVSARIGEEEINYGVVDAITLLTELANDLERIERTIVDRMIDRDMAEEEAA